MTQIEFIMPIRHNKFPHYCESGCENSTVYLRTVYLTLSTSPQLFGVISGFLNCNLSINCPHFVSDSTTANLPYAPPKNCSSNIKHKQ